MKQKQKNQDKNEISDLVKALNNLSDKRVIKMYESRWMFFWYNIYKGMLTGLGTVLGATVVIALLIHFSQYFINWPIIGDILTSLFDIIQEYNEIKQGSAPMTPSPIPVPIN